MVEGEAAPLGNFASFSAVASFSNVAASCAVISSPFPMILSPGRTFRQGCNVQPLGLTLPFFTKWVIVYSHFRSQVSIRLHISKPSPGLISRRKLQLTAPSTMSTRAP